MRRNHCSRSRCSTSVVFVPPAASVDHLLVGQHGGALRAPVHLALLAIRQPALQHAQEKPLVPAVVLGQAGGDFGLPVVAQAQPLASGGACAAILLQGPLARRRVVLERRIFRRAVQRHPIPWDGARCSPASTCSAPGHRQWRSCARGPCAAGPTDRAASRARNTLAWRCFRARRGRDPVARPSAAASALRSPPDHSDRRAQSPSSGWQPPPWPQPPGRIAYPVCLLCRASSFPIVTGDRGRLGRSANAAR